MGSGWLRGSRVSAADTAHAPVNFGPPIFYQYSAFLFLSSHGGETLETRPNRT